MTRFIKPLDRPDVSQFYSHPLISVQLGMFSKFYLGMLPIHLYLLLDLATTMILIWMNFRLRQTLI